MSTVNKGGRPRKDDIYKGHIRAAEDKVADRLSELFDNLFSLAGGIWMEETTNEGGRRVYSRAPCRQSNEYLINRIMGKPKETQEISGPDGSAVKILVEYTDDISEAPEATLEPGSDPEVEQEV